ncbi:MAG: acyl-CoA dehydrogenase family protein [Acidimicrobiales bacterium]|nr:acyl-CoA dehydrogenase family protein [Acidimicrobiales bacterium]
MSTSETGDRVAGEGTTGDPVTEVKKWLAESWDPDLTVAEWWDRLGRSGWAAPGLPENSFGRGLSRSETVAVQEAVADFGALPAPGGIGLLLAAPTIAVHGTPEQRDRYVGAIVTGQEAWCQLFSEPAAGSDLAGLQTRAVRDGHEWVITGQKVWTSGGKVADLAMLLARTDPDVPKHQGITYFAFDMRQPGVEVRPLREMTGRALFNEVFINEARVTDDAVIGGVNNGWAVANTTLGFERAGLGAGGGSAAASTAMPGSIAGDLDKRVGDLVGARARGGSGGPGGLGNTTRLLMAVARELGATEDPCVRQDLVRLHTLSEIGRYMSLRQKALKTEGGDIPGMGNMAKLSMSIIVRLSRDLGLRMLGARGMLHGYDTGADDALSALAPGPLGGLVTELALFAQGPPIYGGTDEIQHNIIGERVLGLPKEPNRDKVTPFKDLPKN